MKEENIKGEYQRKVDKSLIPTCNIMGVNIAAINMNWLLKYLDANLSDIKGDYICVSNVHTTVTSYEDAAYCAVQNGGLMAIPDGGPLSSVGRKRGYSDMDRTTGPSLMGEIFKISAEKGYRHYFYGSTEETLKLLEEKLQENYPGIQIAGMYANGPSSAVVVGDRAYIVDFGPGVVRQASAAYFNGIDALRPDLLTVAFCTHLHTDHTAGYPDLIFTPWVLERPVPLKVFGPKGMQHMTDHILKAYETDIDFRINGFEKANESGYRVEVTEIESGIIYKDDRVTVEAFPVSHGTLECYGYKFITPDKTIVITGDTAPLDIVAEKAKDCDILLHEVEYAAGISCREPKWQKYHREVHTLSTDLAQVAKKANPKLLVTYHRIYHMNIQDNRKNLAAEMAWRDEAILDEIREAGYEGYVVNGKDLDIF